MITFETAKSMCPICGYGVDHATFAHAVDTPTAPKAGDASICLNCSSVNVFSDAWGNLRRPTDTERKTFANDKRISKAVRAIQEMWAERLINESR